MPMTMYYGKESQVHLIVQVQVVVGGFQKEEHPAEHRQYLFEFEQRNKL
jgi:hypothetical protein